MQKEQEKAPRINVLDGLRALAILLVLGRHSIRPFWEDISVPFVSVGGIDLANPLVNGWIGVDLFFVLSGFLITVHLLQRYFPDGNHTGLGSYFKRRFFRIAPAYYLVLTMVVLGLFPFYPYPESTENIGWRYLYHLLYLQDYLPSDLMVVFWSLAVEFKFYILAPFIIWGLLKLPEGPGRLGAVATLLGALLALRFYSIEYWMEDFNDYAPYFFNLRTAFHLSLDGLLFGMICGLIYNAPSIMALFKKPVMANGCFYGGLALIGFFAFSAPLVDLHVSYFDKMWLPFFIALGFAAMMMGLLSHCYGYKLFTGRFLYFIALISYSLYLVHLPMLYLAEMIAVRVIDIYAFSPPVMYALYLPFFLGLCCMAASLLYICVEKPFIDWSHGRRKLWAKPDDDKKNAAKD
ncbi:MAG: acyltransferase family protein [Alphaproteobacteria bacterium]